MTDALKKVKAGDPLVIPATTFNTFIDTARDYQNRQQQQWTEPRGQALPAGQILVKNDSGADRDRLDVLALTGPLIDPADAPDGWIAGPTMVGGLPVAGSTAIAILLQPVAAGKIGRAVVDGLAVARVHVNSDANPFACPSASTAAYLESAIAGPARILWVQPSTDRTGGIGLALVSLCNVAVEESSFLATITGHSSIGDNRWAYTFQRVLFSGNGVVAATEGTPLTGTALNRLEVGNDGAGEEYCQIDLDDPAPADSIDIYPIFSGTLVRIDRSLDAAGAVRYDFSVPNRIKPTCPA